MPGEQKKPEEKKQAEKKQDEKKGDDLEKKEDPLVGFVEEMGLSIDIETLKTAQQQVKMELHDGTKVTLAQYEVLLLHTFYEYSKFGIVNRVASEMTRQNKGKPPDRMELRWVIKELAERQLKHGLVPLQHTIPLHGNVYIKIEGRRFIAKTSGVPYSCKFEVLKNGDKDNVWRHRCVITIIQTGQTFEGVGKASAATYHGDKENIEDMSMKRAEAHALDKAFPLGVSFEDAYMIQKAIEGREEIENETEENKPLVETLEQL